MSSESSHDPQSLSDWPDALVAAAERALGLGQSSAERYERLALDSYDQSNVEDAIKYYQMALRRVPGDADLHAALGQIYFEKREFDRAERHFRSALESDPDNLWALKGLAFTLHDRGDAGAIHMYLKYLERDPEDIDVLLNVGVILANDERHDEALGFFTRAEKLGSNDAVVCKLKGQSLYALGRLQEAIGTFRTAMKFDPKDLEISLFLGQALWAAGDVDDAYKCYRDAVAVNPEDPRIRLEFARLLNDRKRYDVAAEHGRFAAEEFERRGDFTLAAEAYWDLGWALYGLERWPESVAASETALKHDPSLFAVRFNLALTLLHAGSADKAREEYEKGINMLPDLADLKYYAIDDLMDALKKEPDLPSGHEILKFLEETYESRKRPAQPGSSAEAAVSTQCNGDPHDRSVQSDEAC